MSQSSGYQQLVNEQDPEHNYYVPEPYKFPEGLNINRTKAFGKKETREKEKISALKRAGELCHELNVDAVCFLDMQFVQISTKKMMVLSGTKVGVKGLFQVVDKNGKELFSDIVTAESQSKGLHVSVEGFQVIKNNSKEQRMVEETGDAYIHNLEMSIRKAIQKKVK